MTDGRAEVSVILQDLIAELRGLRLCVSQLRVT